MSKFVMMLFDNPADFADFSPEQMQQVVQEYGSWAEQMAKEGKFVSGEKLTEDGGKIIARRGDGITVTDGPFAESKEVLGGIFIIQAASYDDAVEIAKTSPHVKYGASTHVRQIDDV